NQPGPARRSGAGQRYGPAIRGATGVARRQAGFLMSGQLVYVMGPSGSGKDSLLQQAAGRAGSRLHLMKRYITRSAESEGEDAFSVSPEEVDAMQARGAFAMSWRANGLAYGIAAELDTRLAQGQTVLVNGSRAYCESAVQRYPSVLVV